MNGWTPCSGLLLKLHVTSGRLCVLDSCAIAAMRLRQPEMPVVHPARNFGQSISDLPCKPTTDTLKAKASDKLAREPTRNSRKLEGYRRYLFAGPLHGDPRGLGQALLWNQAKVIYITCKCRRAEGVLELKAWRDSFDTKKTRRLRGSRPQCLANA